ncbi:DNA polymerase III subunit epsilon [Salinispirillum sp. LH 10-3-1]|uniref:DNA polymerase III subunit epsilon n=1 Tax=Salinispirillum sp. LH 10-3-1 TaxID=2952525 RepID=A0AB38YIU7_9GAMM
MRQIVLDTETTGLDPSQGHRVIEIGCVEVVDRKLTGNHYHVYINPQRNVPEDAIAIHGITNEFLADKPVFADIAESFFDFVRGAELVIHNAPFDMGFLNHELRTLRSPAAPLENHCTVLDTLYLARQKHPGQKNNLDALCKRYGIDNGHRDLHGALLDAEILADVYLFMTGGQTALELAAETPKDNVQDAALAFAAEASGRDLPVIEANSAELAAHEHLLALIDKKSDGALWKHSG